ncbi:MAG: polysaccharide deacetylase family protein [Neomegalonema sp.]|nr:polysaccharide deacetylase family protein [Neomegalonema sp.]
MKTIIPRAYDIRWLRPSTESQVLLTFDDGPNPEYTPKVMDALDQLNAKAIFFVLGREVRKHPALLHEIVARGHVIGNHSDTHPMLPTLSAQGIRDELKRCQAAVADILGGEPVYFRPPRGAASPKVWAETCKLGLETIQWSNEGGEYGGRSGMDSNAIAAELGASLSDSQIILLHDDSQIAVDILTSSALRAAAETYQLNFDIPLSLSGAQRSHPALRTTANHTAEHRHTP